MAKLIVITGPTGVGKTKTAIEIALLLNTEIISADSRQFYKEIPIGTAAPSPDECKTVPHHFVGHLSVTDYYNAYMYQNQVLKTLKKLFTKHEYVVICGGSGMYIDAVCNGIDNIPDIDPELREKVIEQFKSEGIEGLRSTVKKLDPEYYSQVDLKNPVRLMRAIEVCLQTGKTFSSVRTNSQQKRDFSTIHIALTLDREILYNRINERVLIMIQNGMIDEARSVHHLKEYTALKTVGYRELFDFFEGKIDKKTAIEKIQQHSRHYAKRQLSWIKRNPDYAWYNPEDISKIFTHIKHSHK